MVGNDSRLAPTFEIEADALRSVGGPVAGVDEAGRGPWAGPVVAAAVILAPDNIPEGIADSKVLPPEVREALYPAIMASAVSVGVGVADVARIDRINILRATLWAMRTAVTQLSAPPRLALVDGNRAPRLGCRTRTIVDGDDTCVSIAAASIVAKVTRDRIMDRYHRRFPDYGFRTNKGYGTEAHWEALWRFGPTPIHRRSFNHVLHPLSPEEYRQLKASKRLEELEEVPS
jgi:ribonuclease HII